MQPQESIQLNMVLSKNKPVHNMRRGNPKCLQKMTWGGVCILSLFLSIAQPLKKYFSSRIFRNPLYEITLVVSKPGFVRMNTKNVLKKNCRRFWTKYLDADRA